MRKDYYLVEFKEFGASSLDIMLYCFMDATTWTEELRARSELNLEIMRLAADLGVSFAFPTRTLHVASQAEAVALPEPTRPRRDDIDAVLQRFRAGKGDGKGDGNGDGKRPPESGAKS